MFTYQVELLQFLVSPAHAYFGRARDGAANVPTAFPHSIDLVDGKGIRGDRYFGVRAHTDAAVTFLAIEAWRAALAAVTTPTEAGVFPTDIARRNVTVRGVDLDALREVEFDLDTGSGPVLFRGARPAHPCVWMDSMVAEGMRKALVGRGGIRAAVLSSGRLDLGPAVLRSPVELDARRAATPVMRAQPVDRHALTP